MKASDTTLGAPRAWIALRAPPFSGMLPLTNVLASLPRFSAPHSYRTLASGSLRDFIRSTSDLQTLADMFHAGDSAKKEDLLVSVDGELDLPMDFCFPFSIPLRDASSRSSAHSGRSLGEASPRQDEGVDQSPRRSPPKLDLRRGSANGDEDKAD